MSGGSLDYAEFKMNDVAEEIESRIHSGYGSFSYSQKVQLKGLAAHIRSLGRLLHAVEWDMSGDASMREEDWSLLQELVGPKQMLDTATQEARDAEASLREAIALATNPKKAK